MADPTPDTLSDDDCRALSMALGHHVAVLRMPPIVDVPIGGRGPRIVWQSDTETASVVADEVGAITVHTVPRLQVKDALDLASALVAVAARTAAGAAWPAPGTQPAGLTDGGR